MNKTDPPAKVASNDQLGMYPERDHIAQGQYYIRHVDAMTREGLHSKSRIAGELAARDIEIDRLRADVDLQAAIGRVLADAMGQYGGSRETPDYAVEVAVWLDGISGPNVEVEAPLTAPQEHEDGTKQPAGIGPVERGVRALVPKRDALCARPKRNS